MEEQVKKEWHDVPSGSYEAWVNSITFGETKTGKPRATIIWRVINGPERGNRIYDNVTLSEIGAEILQKKLAMIAPWEYQHNAKLTYEEEAEQIMSAVHDVRYRISVGYNDKGFVKVYIDGKA